jgi:inosine-uridine nucleoside N-ribohydrolase
MTEKIILDTDIGSDIDDAICLAYLLANPKCQLMGITTVTGEGEKRAQMASALCQIARKEIPIFIGAEEPLLVDQRQPHAPQAAALLGWSRDIGFPRGEAISFLVETIREHPGEITLLTIGPLTNIALLFRTDPEIPNLLKGLVMMAGIFEDQRPEWNAMLDPHASAIVYRSQVAVHRSIGLDVTRQVTLPADEIRQRFQTPLLRPVLDFAEVWFQERDEIVFHDPLAAITIFDGGICGFMRGQIQIELDNPEALGQTHWEPNPDGRHEVALSVEPEKFLKKFFSFFEN